MRRVLLLASLLVLAGCVSATPPGSSLTGSCDDYNLTTPDPVRENITAREYPDRPENFTNESARRFAVAYEKAYKYNTLLENNTRRINITIQNSTVDTPRGHHHVRIEARWDTWTDDPSKNGSNETTVYTNGSYTVGYLVTEDRLLRDEGAHDATPAPLMRGRSVECW